MSTHQGAIALCGRLHDANSTTDSDLEDQAHKNKIRSPFQSKLNLTMTPIKVFFVFLFLSRQSAAWAPLSIPKDLRTDERTWRFPESTKTLHSEGIVGSPSWHYMDEPPSQPEPTQLRHSNVMASGSYMMEMRSPPNPAELRHSDVSDSYQGVERLWGIPSAKNAPLKDNIMIAPRLSDSDRTWRFPKKSQIISSEVPMGLQYLDAIGVSDEHVKTLFVETKRHLPDWENENVLNVLSKLDENASDFLPPELKESVTTLYYQAHTHLPDSQKERVPIDFDDMAPSPEYLH